MIIRQKKSRSYLLHLEFDGTLEVVDLLLHVVGVGEKSRELSGLVQTRTQKTRDLLDQRL
jgi:hypothetical protein